MRKRIWAAVILLFVAALFSVALAQSDEFDLPWFSIDGGSGVSDGGRFELRGVIGQSEAGSLTGGNFAVGGGFLALPVDTGQLQHAVLLPMVTKPI